MKSVRSEKLFRQVLKLDPDNGRGLGNFANFLTDVKGEHEEAEKLYRRSLEIDPDNANKAGNFANFLTDVRGEHEEAEKLYRRSLELDPDQRQVRRHVAASAVARSVHRGFRNLEEAVQLRRPVVSGPGADADDVGHLRFRLL